MKSADIASYRLLAERAGVSRWQIQQLRKGQIQKMRLVALTQIAAALGIKFFDLYSHFAPDQTALGQSNLDQLDQPELDRPKSSQPESDQTEASTADADRSQLEREHLQADALQTLESWLVQWPTIAKRATDRPDLPAAKILPFVRPVEQLMSDWGIEPIAAVDSQVAFDPTRHQLIAGHAEPGDRVRVTHAGNTHHGKLLHRAKVKSV